MVVWLLALLAACTTEQPAASATEADTADNSDRENGTTGDDLSAATTSAGAAEAGLRPAGWSEDSHGDDADPNYEVVFPQDEVNQITITIAPEDWEAMQANMTELLGEQGSGGSGPGGFGPPGGGERPEGFAPPGGERPGGVEIPEDLELPQGHRPGRPGEGGGPGLGGDFTPENPMWVPATVEFDGQTWTNVGVRYKGNSSLRSAWQSGSLKLPLKLDFDEFEDDYPEIDDQRFYGFKQLSLANGFGDNTYMRDTITYDLFEDAGLVAAETAYYEVILDYGEGPVNLGLYTMIEVIDDTVIDRAFGDDDGNIYEGDGRAASLAEGTFAEIKNSFQKENNKEEADYGDIEALYHVLHSDQRTGDPEAWRAGLESIFDVDTFLEWLAISSAIQHWDRYGAMSHNYYLYNDPDTGRLTWISWDHNLVLGGNRGGIGRNRAGGDTLDQANVDDNWPLIRFLLDDLVYYEAYIGYLGETVALLNPDEMATRYQELAALLRPYAAREDGGQAFDAAVEQLTEITYDRQEAVIDFLANR